jgi:hypothetical protein
LLCETHNFLGVGSPPPHRPFQLSIQWRWKLNRYLFNP